MRVLFIVYDNNSYMTHFPNGTAYLASVCRNAGHDVVIYNQDVYHYSEEHLVNYLTHNHFDVIGIGVIGGYYQYKKLLKLSKAINSIPKRPLFVLGGHGPSPEPEYFIKKTNSDVVVIGEGEKTIINLLNAFENNNSFEKIKGIAYRNGDEIIINPREDLIKNIDDIPFPAYDLFPMEYYTLLREVGINATERCIPILTGRGCLFTCNFCYRMDRGYRPRSPEAVIEEMRLLKRNYHVSFFLFTDELFMAGERKTIEFCERIISSDLNIRYACSGRLNYATPEVLQVMKKAGCAFINYGIESLDEKALERMNKNLTVSQIVNGIENTIKEMIIPGFNIIWGNIGEDANSLKLGVDFLLKYNTYAQLRTIRPVTPYPGSPLYYYAIENGLLKGPEDFYEKKHLNSDLLAVNFTELSNEEFYKELYNANKILIDNYFNKKKEENDLILKKLYLSNDASFRGFRQT